MSPTQFLPSRLMGDVTWSLRSWQPNRISLTRLDDMTHVSPTARFRPRCGRSMCEKTDGFSCEPSYHEALEQGVPGVDDLIAADGGRVGIVGETLVDVANCWPPRHSVWEWSAPAARANFEKRDAGTMFPGNGCRVRDR